MYTSDTIPVYFLYISYILLIHFLYTSDTLPVHVQYIYPPLKLAHLALRSQLWALLHFIMPTLFDSHDEFNEWFSKDIENFAEKQSGLDEGK